MKVEFLVENIERYASLISKVIPAHAQIPVLSNILVEANKTGFFISATDLELGVRIKIPAKIEEEGAITIPGRQFLEIITSLPKDKVTLIQEDLSLLVLSRDNKIKLQGIPREEFPVLYQEKGENKFTFSGADFKKVFSKLLFAVSQDEARPQLTGVYLFQKDGSVDFVATDGYRLSLKKIDGKILGDGEGLIISSRLIAEALSLKDDFALNLYVYEEGNQILLESEEVIFIGRSIEGNFPNYERIIPQESRTQLFVNKEEFMRGIKVSSVFARDSANVLKLKIKDKKIEVLSKTSGIGEGEVRIDVEQEGEDNEIAFNAKFLMDILRVLEDESIALQLNSPIEPAIFKSEKEKDFLHIIMPVRIQD